METLRSRFQRAQGKRLSERILFLPSRTAEEYYRLLSVMDVVLDTPVYSASLTGYDAFALGVPIVTLPGRHMVQRYALGLYRQMEMNDLIASAAEEYVELAVRLGRDSEYCQETGRTIRERSGVLFAHEAVIGEYEAFFVRTVEQRRLLEGRPNSTSASSEFSG